MLGEASMHSIHLLISIPPLLKVVFEFVVTRIRSLGLLDSSEIIISTIVCENVYLKHFFYFRLFSSSTDPRYFW